MVKKCLVSVFSRPSAALALPPQPKWHVLAQKTSIHAANAMEATGRPRDILMPARVRTEWARPRKTGRVVFHWYSTEHLGRTGGFSVFLTVCTRECWNFDRESQVARADRERRATGRSSPSPSGPMLKALKSISFDVGLKRSYSSSQVQQVNLFSLKIMRPSGRLS